MDRPAVAVTTASSVPREGELESYHSEKLLKREREREKKKRKHVAALGSRA